MIRRRGAAMVEFAIVLPVLLLLLLGILEFGFLWNDKILLRGAVNEGARAAVVLGKPVGVVKDDTVNTAVPDVLARENVEVDYEDSQGHWVEMTDPKETVRDPGLPQGPLDIRVMIRDYHHRLIGGSFFSFLADRKDGTVTLSPYAILSR